MKKRKLSEKGKEWKLNATRFIECMCRAKFLGKNADFNQHLKYECPVFAEAARRLGAKK